MLPEKIDVRAGNLAPLSFQYEITTCSKRIWVSDTALVAERESTIWRKYWDGLPRLERVGNNMFSREWSSEMTLNMSGIRRRLRKLDQYIKELESQQVTTLEIIRSDFTLQILNEQGE